MNERLRASILEKKARLDALRPLPASVVGRLREQIMVEWTFNSNAIEGNTLTLKETALILQEGVTVAGKSMREHLEAVNHRAAVESLEEWVSQKNTLTEDAILGLHALILKGIDDGSAGCYRGVRVRILGAVHIPPDPAKVPRLMEALTAWYRENKNKMDPVDLAARLHHKLVHVHPFVDGNGRCARLLMNLALMGAGFPPAVILKTDRRRYYRVLAEMDQGREDPCLDFVGRAVERSLVLYLHAATPKGSADYEKQGYISLAEASRGTPYSQEYLSLLARRGILPAVKFQRNWATTRDAVREYVRSHAPS